jgi:threonine/homoserine/homoserine lactone efflux protein
MFLFGCVAVLIAIVTDSAWAAVAGTARQWFSRSARRGEVMAATGGAMMIGLGVGLAVTGRRD